MALIRLSTGLVAVVGVGILEQLTSVWNCLMTQGVSNKESVCMFVAQMETSPGILP